MSDVPVVGPETVSILAAGEARRLLRLSSDKREALFREMQEASLALETLDKKQVDALAQRVGVSEREVRAAFSLSSFLKQYAAKDPEALEQFKHKVLSGAQTSDSQALPALMAQIENTAEALEKQYSRIDKISRALATYTGCFVASGLRLIHDDETNHKELVPVAIIRVATDEEDPMVFQCTSQQIAHLMEKLKEGQRELDMLAGASRNIPL